MNLYKAYSLATALHAQFDKVTWSRRLTLNDQKIIADLQQRSLALMNEIYAQDQAGRIPAPREDVGNSSPSQSSRLPAFAVNPQFKVQGSTVQGSTVPRCQYCGGPLSNTAPDPSALNVIIGDCQRCEGRVRSLPMEAA